MSNHNTKPLQNKAENVVRVVLVDTFVGGATGPVKDENRLSYTRAEWRAQLVHVVARDKQAVGAVSPVDYRAKVPGAVDKQRNGKVIKSGIGRHPENVVGGSPSVWLDFDKIPEQTARQVLDLVQASGWTGEAWTSHSHGKQAGLISFRLRLETDFEQSADEVSPCRRGLSVLIARAVGHAAPHIADTSCFQPVTIFYLPAVHPERVGTERVWTFNGAVDLSVDALMKLGQDELAVARKQAVQRLVREGKVTIVGATDDASEADRQAARLALSEDCGTLACLGDARKRLAHRLGLKYGATVRVGGIDEAVVRAAFDGALGESIYASHFENGFATGAAGRAREVSPIRAYDAVVDAAVAEGSGLTRAHDQFAAQAPGEQVDVDTAREQLARDVSEATNERRLTVIQYPAGTGKSDSSAAVIAERARSGHATVYSAPDHTVVHQTRSLLPPDVLARSVHLHSVLVQVGDGPVCARTPELKTAVFELGANQHAICRKCPLRAGCAARDAYEQRAKTAKNRSTLAFFVSHSGIEQVASAERALIVDEMPAPFERVTVSRADLTSLAAGGVCGVVDAAHRAVVETVAKGWLTGEMPEHVTYRGLWKASKHPVDLQDAVEATMGMLRLTDDTAETSDAVAGLLRAARAVLRIAYSDVEPEVGDSGVSAMLPGAAHAALTGYGGVLLSANPTLAALPNAELRKCEVRDACPWHQRTMHFRTNSGKRALVDDDGTPWARLSAYAARLRQAAGKGRILLVTFKAVVDALRAQPDLIGGLEGIELAHFGAVRGRNDWQEGAERACRVFATWGDPWLGSRATLEALGLEGDALWAATRDEAAGELYQAHERARNAWRRFPVQHFHEGAVVPLGWHGGNATMEDLDALAADAFEALEYALLYGRTAVQVAEACGVQKSAVSMWRDRRSVPPEHGPALDRLRPTLSERVRMNGPARKPTGMKQRDWAPKLAATEARRAYCAMCLKLADECGYEAESKARSAYLAELVDH